MLLALTMQWDEMSLYHFMAVGGGAVALLAVVCYFFPPTKIKIPAVIVGSLCGVLSGIGVGVILMSGLGYHWDKMPSPSGEGNQGGGRMGGGMGGGGMGGGGMGQGGGGGGGMRGGGFGGRGPNAKNQLVGLVTKIDQMTSKPLNLNLSEEQKKKVTEQIQGLENLAELTEDDAKKRLDALLELVKGEKEKMEAAGYRWPGEQGGGTRGSGDMPNPFKTKENTDHLKSLAQQFSKK